MQELIKKIITLIPTALVGVEKEEYIKLYNDITNKLKTGDGLTDFGVSEIVKGKILSFAIDYLDQDDYNYVIDKIEQS